MILTQEGNPLDDLHKMITLTRKKIHGVFHCDCLTSPSVEVSRRLQNNFDVIVTIFCVEYCCNTLQEYRSAIRNIADQVKPGGMYRLYRVQNTPLIQRNRRL
ncbi:unnamed protein product [Cylicostephanus goldi]|uniref:Methyltransferase type 11 domain-containing protein n=1 Tax=Cylicostephanus goldi TaxID=71465 RepID=A0A3P7MBD8_CYLGO|nr:unnamed protein product [Cylicostephanus goldi]